MPQYASSLAACRAWCEELYLECKAVVDEHIASRKKKYGQHFDTVIVVLWTLSWYAIASASYWYCMQSGGTTLASVQLGLLWAMAIFNLCARPPLPSLSFSSPRGSGLWAHGALRSGCSFLVAGCTARCTVR